MNEKITYSVLVLVVIVFLGAVFAVKYFSVDEWRCLGENEIIDYVIEEEGLSGLINVSVADNNQELIDFKIKDIVSTYNPVEIHDCGVYVMKLFNFDVEKFNKDPGYREPGFKIELWKYDFLGKGKSLILLDAKDSSGKATADYSYDFRVDPLERYVVLEKEFPGKEDYSLVIKDLETKEDVYVLLYADAKKKYLELSGGIRMRDWNSDGRYFWGSESVAVGSPSYIRIDTETWSYEIFSAPAGQMGGEQINPENGWVTHHTDLLWCEEEEPELIAERLAKGVGTKFYIYNLIIGEEILVYETDQPNWFTKPKWLSATKLEYELPNGEKRVYELR